MNTDSYFEIGSSHIICQDYALHGFYDDMAYTIISDGCSEGRYSEVGAQIICHVAKHAIISLHQVNLFQEADKETLCKLLGNSIHKRIEEVGRLYPITSEALQATLIIALSIQTYRGGYCSYVFAWGDGVIILKDDSGNTYIHEIEYPSGAPFYLVTDPTIYRKSIEAENCKVIHKFYIENDDGRGFYTHSEIEHQPEKIFYLKQEMDIVSITICSDGIKSYQNENLIKIPFVDIVPEYVDYASETGVFVECNMKFLKKKMLKQKWTHYDDICHGSIIC